MTIDHPCRNRAVGRNHQHASNGRPAANRTQLCEIDAIGMQCRTIAEQHQIAGRRFGLEHFRGAPNILEAADVLRLHATLDHGVESAAVLLADDDDQIDRTGGQLAQRPERFPETTAGVNHAGCNEDAASRHTSLLEHAQGGGQASPGIVVFVPQRHCAEGSGYGSIRPGVGLRRSIAAAALSRSTPCHRATASAARTESASVRQPAGCALRVIRRRGARETRDAPARRTRHR